VLAVTHATMRTLLAAELARRGWGAPAERPFREWSAWRFAAPATAPATAPGGLP
jgi:hypothetical protein